MYARVEKAMRRANNFRPSDNCDGENAWKIALELKQPAQLTGWRRPTGESGDQIAETVLESPGNGARCGAGRLRAKRGAQKQQLGKNMKHNKQLAKPQTRTDRISSRPSFLLLSPESLLQQDASQAAGQLYLTHEGGRLMKTESISIFTQESSPRQGKTYPTSHRRPSSSSSSSIERMSEHGRGSV
uniref:HDC15091 n=1 Tax=Drosophila melanogaster TaxID=7227 RepID=Q6IJE2_DROME|nr:TPA_inf: HDC15091 [Drosophila melanogaster]